LYAQTRIAAAPHNLAKHLTPRNEENIRTVQLDDGQLISLLWLKETILSDVPQLLKTLSITDPTPTHHTTLFRLGTPFTLHLNGMVVEKLMKHTPI
jgi:hypothetical protein